MTGPEHYREAEAWAHRAADYVYGDRSGDAHGVAQGQGMAALAQVHATLALAAATAMNGHSETGMPTIDWTSWDAVAGVQPGAPS